MPMPRDAHLTAALHALLDKSWKPWINAAAKARIAYPGRFSILAAAFCRTLDAVPPLPPKTHAYLPEHLTPRAERPRY
jgi:hypothetical protein